MSETTYRANCHCGKFVYEVTLPSPLTQAYTCNCSICSKKAYLFAFEPESGINIVKGSLDELTSYAFGDKYFCGDCGSAVLIINNEPGKGRALNIRCFQNVDLKTLKTLSFDGAALPPAYKEPEFTGTEPTGELLMGGTPTIYHGSCHCGAVRLAVRCQPLDETLSPTKKVDRIVDCSCSICARYGCRWFYPNANQVTIQDPDNNIVRYVFCTMVTRKTFCGKCGVPLTSSPLDLTDEELAKLPDYCRTAEAHAVRERMQSLCPVNTRVLHGVDQAKLPVQYVDNNREPKYVLP